MPEKKPRPILAFPEIETSSSEILVARNRILEPYFHLFSVSPENITQKPLGQIMGVFSMSDLSESSAYIVNAIASVAKKEYFMNPRRGAIESLESTLHRVNLALAELVKDGQMRWMGNLHGAIAIIEKGNIHFSVTGNGVVLLYRDGALSDISEGLASEEASTHPIKTFVEISSGRLIAGDRILLVSPEIFSLFSLKELGRNAKRLIPEGKFAQFLETAMMNDLEAGSVLLLSVSERTELSPETERKQTRAPKNKPGKNANFFSDTTFREAEQDRAKIFLEDDVTECSTIEKSLIEAESEESSRTRSGEIFVEGEAPPEKKEHPFITNLRWKTEDFLSSLRTSTLRSLRDFVTDAPLSVSEFIRSSTFTVSKSIRKALIRSVSIIKRDTNSERNPNLSRKKTAVHTKRPRSVSTHSEKHIDNRKPVESHPLLRQSGQSENTSIETKNKTSETDWHDEILRSISFFLRTVISNTSPILRLFYEKIRDAILFSAKQTAKATIWSWEHFFGLSKKQQLIAACAAAFCATLFGIGLIKGIRNGQEPEPPSVIIAELQAPSFPPTGESNSILVDTQSISGVPNGIVMPIYLNDAMFLATTNGIYNITTHESFTLPSDSPIILGTGMNDLGLVFVITLSGDVFSFSPPNGSFTKNTITFPSGLHPAGIGAFLTYLYLLDSGSGKIYRFPRSEGGFGESVLWTKGTPDPSIESISVSENIYGRNPMGVTSYFRGRSTDGFSFEKPNASELKITSICANQDAPDTFAVLDASARRFILYDRNGRLQKQYFSESLAEMTACAIGKDGLQAIISSSSNVAILSLTH